MLRKGLQLTLEKIHELEQMKAHGGCLWQPGQGLREALQYSLGRGRRETWAEEEGGISELRTFGIRKGWGN